MKAGLTVVVDGRQRPVCGCCLETPADGAYSPPFGPVCLGCFDALLDAQEVLTAAGLVGCRAIGPDHNEGGAQ